MNPLRQFAKVRVLNTVTGREWIGYNTKDLVDTIDIHVPVPGGYQRVVLSGPDYFLEAV